MTIIRASTKRVNSPDKSGEPARHPVAGGVQASRSIGDLRTHSPGGEDSALQECNTSAPPGPLGPEPDLRPQDLTRYLPGRSPDPPGGLKAINSGPEQSEGASPLGNVRIFDRDPRQAKYIKVTDHRKRQKINRLDQYPAGLVARRFKGSNIRFGGGERGEIRGFSLASRRRLRQYLIQVPWACVDATFVTLTYHNHWGEPADWKRDYTVFEKRAFRRFEHSLIAVVWRREFQQRGAPHYHPLFVWKKSKRPQEYWFKAWVRRNWLHIIGASDDLDARKHGTSAIPVTPERGGMGPVIGYLVNEMGKTSQGIRPDQETGELLPTGRMWGGTLRLPRDPAIEVTLTEEEWAKFCARLNKRGQEVNSWYLANLNGNWPGFTLLGSTEEVAPYFERWYDDAWSYPEPLSEEVYVMATAACPLCDNGVVLRGRVKVGRRARCPNCCADLMVTDLAPLKLHRVGPKVSREGSRRRR